MKLAALLLLSLAVFTTADLHAGEREEGDVLAVVKPIIRKPVPGRPGVAIQVVGSPGRITAVDAVNNPGSNAAVRILAGGPNDRKLVLLATSPIGTGINVTVNVFAVLPGTPPPPPPPSTVTSRPPSQSTTPESVESSPAATTDYIDF